MFIHQQTRGHVQNIKSFQKLWRNNLGQMIVFDNICKMDHILVMVSTYFMDSVGEMGT
jgi:hypothetical protein